MKCKRCGERVSNEMADQVADNFDYDDPYSNPICWNCAVERFNEQQQDQTMKNPCQDEGD